MLEGKEIVILLNSRFQRLSSNPLFVPFRSIVNLLHRQLIIGKRKYRIRDEIKRIERTPSVLHLEWNSGKSFYEFIEVSSDGFHRGNYRFFEWNVSIPAKCKQSVYVSQKGVIFKSPIFNHHWPSAHVQLAPRFFDSLAACNDKIWHTVARRKKWHKDTPNLIFSPQRVSHFTLKKI